MIFLNVAQKLQSKEIITSGVGIREGVYLNDILPISKRFPANFNPSIRSLQDRFLPKVKNKIPLYAAQLFDELVSIHSLESSYKTSLINAAKLCEIGSYLDFYYANDHSAYFILNALNYNFSHQEKILVASIIKLEGRKIAPFIEPYKDLLPDEDILLWLSFILAISKLLAQNYCGDEKLEFNYNDNILYIYSKNSLNIAKDALKKIVLPQSLALAFNQKP